jgi:hypothetical protein
MHLSFWHAFLAVAGGALVQVAIIIGAHYLRDKERRRFEQIVKAARASAMKEKKEASNEPPYSTLDELPPGEYEILQK